MNAVRPVVASNGVLYFQMTSIRSHLTSGMERDRDRERDGERELEKYRVRERGGRRKKSKGWEGFVLFFLISRPLHKKAPFCNRDLSPS